MIITDWEMPDINGIEFIKMLKQEKITQNIPVMMCTGIMISSISLKKALEVGFIDFIRKPIDKIELLARIKSMLKLSDYYNSIVELKNSELAYTSMNILQNNEFNMELINRINEINIQIKDKKISRKLIKINKDISFKIKNEAWTQFNNYFQRVHPIFTKKLIAKYPKLTPAEIKLAIFLRLKLTTKEIASIIYITPDSVKTARNRLRKKFKLSPEVNLTTFLLAF